MKSNNTRYQEDTIRSRGESIDINRTFWKPPFDYSTCSPILFSESIVTSCIKMPKQDQNHTAPSRQSLLLHLLLFTSFPSFNSSLAPPLAFQRTQIHTQKNTNTSGNSNSKSDLFMTMQKQSEEVDLALTLPLDKLTSCANSYAAANGLQVETKKSSSGGSSSSSSSSASSSYQCAPISLLPNAFPATAFQNAKVLAPYFNQLVDRISRDGDFLTETLAGGGDASVIAKDEYTKKLLELYTDIYMDDAGGEGSSSKPNFAKSADRLGIQRSDYMLNPIVDDDDDNGSSALEYGLKQVELNTIAASFAGLAVNVAGLHQMMTERFDRELKSWLEANVKAVKGDDDEDNTNDDEVTVGVPTNPALDRLPFAMNVAHEQYQSRFGSGEDTDTKTAILFVVQEGETNTVDQRMLEFQLWKNHRIPVIRMSLTAAKDGLRMDEANGTLYVNANDSNVGEKHEYEVSVVYFRAGYAPTDYPDGYDGIEWASRELIERSRATKCPQLGYHLAGTKKVQQELARPGVLERFFSEEEIEQGVVTRMREAFAGLYSLGEDAVQEDLDAIGDAISSEDGHGLYVLKPQREGGGYNYYGADLAKKIKENVEEGPDGSLKLGEDLAEFILMQRLFPPKQKAVLLRAGLVEGTGESISELGCFGTIVQSCDGQTTLHNEYAGFLLRTKFSNVDEGGVASGFATLSSPYLC